MNTARDTAGLTVLGSINMDLVARVPVIPAPGQTVLGSRFERHPGGKGANQAVAAARLGARVQFFGAVGRDAFGDELLAGLRGEGVDASGVQRVDEASGCALIAVDAPGENAISVLPGANTFAPLPPLAWRASMLLLQLEVPLATCLAWAQAAHAQGARVILNAAPMTALPAALLQTVDVLVVNEGELTALVGDVAAPLQAVSALGPRQVVVTLGERGGRAFDGQRAVDWPGHAVQVVDSTGAGDTFVGALAAGLLAGLAFEPALQRANVAAALSCTAAGARGGMPSALALAAAMR